jgi:hypothetical protein
MRFPSWSVRLCAVPIAAARYGCLFARCGPASPLSYPWKACVRMNEKPVDHGAAEASVWTIV